MIFSWLQRIPWTSDTDDLPGWGVWPQGLLPRTPMTGPPEPEPAAVVPLVRYRSDVPRREGKQNGTCGFVWSSLLAEIARHPQAPTDPWIAGLRRDVA